MRRHPAPARLPRGRRQHRHHPQRGHHPQHRRHAQPPPPEQRRQHGPRRRPRRAGIVVQRERHPHSPTGRARPHRVDRWTDAPTHLATPHPAPREHSPPHSPHEGTAPTPPRRHKLTSRSPVRHGDPCSTRPSSTVSTLGLLWVNRSAFAEGDARAVVPAPGRLAMPVCVPEGRRKDPVLPVLHNPAGAGAHTQAGSWGNATPEGGVSTWEF